MHKKRVAVIDVGSSKVTAVIGERGINKTFIIKGSYSFDYDGYQDGVFFDEEQFKQVLHFAGDKIKKVLRGAIDTVYVGVPGDFVQVLIKESQISFPKKKKILESDVEALFDAAFVLSSSKYTLINRSAIVYELDDFRRLAYPVGAVSEILKGNLSFSVCNNYFIELVKPALSELGFSGVEFVSSMLAQSLYLIDAEVRDRIAVLIDVGYISTTLAIIHGDGIVYQKSFGYGGGYISASIVNKFGIDFEVAESIKRKVNLSKKITSLSRDVVEGDDGKYYPLDSVQVCVTSSLDELSEMISDTLENSRYVIPEYVPLMITGGGIAYIRGAKEHLSGRLGMAVEVVAPRVPLMDKPTESTVLSIMDIALDQNI